MKKNVYILFCFVILSTICSCDNIVEINDPVNTIYFNSFETASDTAGWQGINPGLFVNERGGIYGSKSLHIGGGCVQPAASFQLNNLLNNKYRISFFGRTGSERMSAAIDFSFTNNQYSNPAAIVIKGSQWQYYETEFRTAFTNPSKLTMEIIVGGIIAEDMYLDDLRIEELGNDVFVR